jgi:ABC-type cobalamin/Fe3+-siderophores transport system ATPase subunit
MLHRNSWELPPSKLLANVTEESRAPEIYVLAGTNGAGKSSIIGAMIRKQGTAYFNPDEATKKILAARTGITLDEANSAAGMRELDCSNVPSTSAWTLPLKPR